IGTETDYASEALQDDEDAQDFYRTLVETIVPLYYGADERPDGQGDAWTERAKESLVTNAARFSARRMVIDYVEKYYRPAHAQQRRLEADGSELLNNMVQAKAVLGRAWRGPYFTDVSIDG